MQLIERYTHTTIMSTETANTTETPLVFPANVDILPPEPDIPGVKDEVAWKIYTMLKQGRRYFGSAGASLTHQAFNPQNQEINPALAKIGLEGERETSTILREWIKDKPNAILIDSVHIDTAYKNPNTAIEDYDSTPVDPETGIEDGKDTDHILIIGSYVILIDTKRWKAKRMYSVAENGTVLRSKKPFPGGNIRMRNAIYLWRDYLYPGTNLTGFVFINTEKESIKEPADPDERRTIVVRDNNWWKQPYRVTEKTRFIETLENYVKKAIQENDPQELGIIDSTIISQIVVSAIKPYDARKRVLGEQALKNFR